MKRVIQAGKFKAECLTIMNEVRATKRSVTITKHNQPIAKLVPIEEEKITLFGKMKGTIRVTGDLTQPIGEDWDASL